MTKRKSKRKGKHYNNSKKRYNKNKKFQKQSIENKKQKENEEKLENAEKLKKEIQEEEEIKEKVETKEEEEVKEKVETKEEEEVKEIVENKEKEKVKEKVGNKRKNAKKQTNKRKINKKKVAIATIISIIIISIVIGIIWYVINVVLAVKDVLTIEVGTKTQIEAKEFLKNQDAKGEISLITDISGIDFNKIAEYDVEIKFNNRTYKSKIKLVDTTPPQVEFKDVSAYIDYVFNAEDFIVSKTDVTQMTVEIENQPEIKEYKEYPITIIVKDEGGNETRGNVILNTSYIKKEFTLELGNKLTHEDLLSNPVGDRNLLPQSELDRINSSPIGEYEIKTVNQGVEFITKIKVQDTTPPNLELKDAQIYNDETKIDKSAFIKTVTDASEYTTELKTEIPFKQVGTYDIEIEAKDVHGNTIKKTAKLNIIKDTKGPVFSGLSALTISKNAKVDWNKGVTAKDEKDGTCTFTVNTSSANLGVAGTYTITYTAKDKTGNTTNAKRKVTVSPDASDVSAKATEWLGKSGTSPLGIKNYVANNIKYSTATNRNQTWGAWQGFTTLRGDCYVHAAATNMLLQKAGYSCMIVNATDNSHFWNLVNVGGVWRHLDSTPPRYSANGLMTDAERYATLNGKDWNRDAFPKAE